MRNILITFFIIFWMAVSIHTIDARAKDEHHPGCNTYKCDKRMRAKNHKKTVHRWKAITKPYAGWLYKVRMCESHGNYRTNTGNGFYGAYQFLPSTWRSVGGSGLPHNATPLEQDYRAVKLRITGGTGHWPICG